METTEAGVDHLKWEYLMDEEHREVVQLRFDRKVKLDLI